MKSKKKPLVAAAISALLALAGTASAQATGGSTDKQAGTGRKGRVNATSGKKATKFRRRRHGKKGAKKGARKGKKSSGGTTTQPPK